MRRRRRRRRRRRTRGDRRYYRHKFDEKLFPLTDAPVPDSYGDAAPSEETIYRLINRTFRAAALTAECAIIALVYINRIIQYTGCDGRAGRAALGRPLTPAAG